MRIGGAFAFSNARNGRRIMSEENKDTETKDKEVKAIETKDAKDPAELFSEIYAEVTKLIRIGEIEMMSPNRLAESIAETTGICPPFNMAVEKCIGMYTKTVVESLAKGKKASVAVKAGGLAYSLVMPPLSGAENISDFIACVTHGMLLGAIPGADATRLLYAAQVAHSAIPKNRKNFLKMLKDKPVKKDTNPTKSTTSTGIN